MKTSAINVNAGEKCMINIGECGTMVVGPATVIVLTGVDQASVPGPSVVLTKDDIVKMKETLQDELMSAIHNSGLSYGDAFSVIQRVEAVFMNKGRNFLKGLDIREVADQSSFSVY